MQTLQIIQEINSKGQRRENHVILSEGYPQNKEEIHSKLNFGPTSVFNTERLATKYYLNLCKNNKGVKPLEKITILHLKFGHTLTD